MDILGLSLRQKKILHLLRDSGRFVTGAELARQLGVSSRTIRSDVAGINEALAPHNAQIYSEHSKGYLYNAEDPDAIQSMNQIDIAFLTRDERVRYLAFRFCLSDEPIDIYDLEDEVFVSHTTLEHDLRQLKIRYVLSGPRIRLIQDRTMLSFEQDEQKRRFILNHLFHADWDYHGRNNAYYSYHFLDPDAMDRIQRIIPPYLYRHGVELEDPNLVALNLAIGILIHRTATGHGLPEKPPLPRKDPEVSAAVEEIFERLTAETGRTFPVTEQDEIYRLVAGVRLTDVDSVTPENKEEHFDPETIALADALIRRIREVYRLDLSNDSDFSITLLFFIKYLRTSDHIFYEQDNRDIARESLLAEFEIAWCIQDLALSGLGYYLTETEILHLAQIISGALEYYSVTHPETRLRTVICCHMNMTAAWSLKRKVLAAFDKYLDVTALLPVNAKDVRGFRDTDLILSTVRKPLTQDGSVDTLRIGALFPPEDCLKISAYIQRNRFKRLFPNRRFSIGELFRNALLVSLPGLSERFEIIEAMAGRLIAEGIVTVDYETDLLRREAISSFCIRPGILFLHSVRPARETRLCAAFFEHPVMWGAHKVRIAVMGAFHPDDRALLLQLNQILNDPAADPEELRTVLTPEDLTAWIEGK